MSIKIDGHEIEETESFKYLGVTLDNKLTGKQHIVHIHKRISRFSGVFYKLKNFANTKVLQLLYFELVYPHLQYSITTWGSTNSTTLRPLQVSSHFVRQRNQHSKIN